MDADAVIARMRAHLKDLSEQDARLAREWQYLNAQRAAIANEIGNIEVAIRYFDEFAVRAPSKSANQNQLPLPLSGTISDAAAELMRQRGGEVELGELHEALVAAGRLRETPHSRTTLWKTLARKEDIFEKAGHGRWRLVPNHDEAEVITVTR